MSLDIGSNSLSSTLSGGGLPPANPDTLGSSLLGMNSLATPLQQGEALRALDQLGGRVQVANAGAITLDGIGGAALPRGAVRLPGGGIATAVQVLEMLRQTAEFQQVQGVMDRFGLDPNKAADLLGARAYVWASYRAPLFSNAQFSGPTLDRASQAIMTYERAHPGTALLADRGNMAAMQTLQTIANDAVANASVVERRAAVSPALSTSSTNARALVAAGTGMQNWQAHHLIPFAEVAKLPANVQLAIARSGWRMDSPENLTPLPADQITFVSPPNNRVLPVHNSAHSVYSADVANRLTNLRVNGATMTDPQIRTELLAIEGSMRGALVNQAGPYWPRVQ
jgi:hypothetical protein